MSKVWRSGDWQIDLRDDEFADIKFQDQIVLRSVRAVIRDRDWNTADLVIDSFNESANELKFAVHSTGFGAEFAGEVCAKVDGQVATFTMELTALGDYQTNRTGLIVLHSPDLAGATLDVTHSTGLEETLKFPVSISPNQPVFDIAALGWQHNELQIDVAFAGDVFEMEDQRNWSDASYKTYSRPLSKPFPYSVATGEKVLQIIKIQVQPTGVAPAQVTENKIQLHKVGKFPHTQVTASTAPDALPESWETCGNPKDYTAVANTVLVELDLESLDWQAALNRAVTSHNAPSSSNKLDVRFIVRDYEKLQPAVDHLAKLLANDPNLEIVRVGAFDSATHISPQKLTDLLRNAVRVTALGDLRRPADGVASAGDLRRPADGVASAGDLRRPAVRVTAISDPTAATGERIVSVVSGARSHFTELNREQSQILPGATEITYATTPLFHSLTNEQLLESVAMQRIIAEQAVEIAAGKPVHIGPIYLRPRFNNVATAEQPAPAKADLSEGYGAEFTGSNDDRQTSPELAAWVIATAAAASVSGIASITWFEQWGPRGLASETGQEYPAAKAVRALAQLAGQDLYAGASPDGFIWAVGASDETGKITVLASNLHRYPATVAIEIEGATHNLRLEPQSWVQI